MNVIIIEDEQLTARRLESLLAKYDPSIHVMAILPSVTDSVDWLKNNADPDLMFMDIHLEDGQSFSIFEKINLQVPVIFTTAYDEYMIKAFKVNSVDYLMKPVSYEELSAAIDKYRRIHAANGEHKHISALLSAIQPKTTDFKQRFLISIGSRLKTIDISEAAYFYSSDKVTFLVTKDNQRYPIDLSLDKLATVIDPAQFFRINRQMITGLQAIANIHVYPKGRLKLDLLPPMKEDVFVSLDKVVEFKEWLGK
jgi:DNA-binding LytR/AlgR family response regulator